jgi:hypothetical protein
MNIHRPRALAASSALALLLAGLSTAACSGSNSPSPTAKHTQTPSAGTNTAAATTGQSPTLKETALALAAKAGCPNPPDIATNGAPGAFPGAPEVSFTCNIGGSSAYGGNSAFVSVFSSHADELANLAYVTANSGGTLVTGQNFIANVYANYSAWATRLGGTVR